MASLLHVAVGAAGGRWLARRRSWPILCGMVALSMLPDADVLAFSLGIPYAHPFGHRGATHSLAFALALGMLVWAGLRARGRPAAEAARSGVLAGAVVASHPLLDAMTTGGLGVALWWPLSTERIFASWRPIPVAPLGRDMVSARGLFVLGVELLPSLPLLGYALRVDKTPAAGAQGP